MEEDGDGGEDLTPFWLQSNTNLPRAHQLRRHASSVFLSSGLVVFLLLVTAVIFLVFVVPSTLSLSSHIFKPNTVKKSWDSLNVLLVLVAVVFGFLNKNKDEDRYSSSYYGENQESIDSKKNETQKSNPSTPQHWYNFNTIQGEKSNLSISDRWYDYPDLESKVEYKNPILRRNSSSYPDLREFSSTRWAHEDFQRRFEDDMNVGTSRVVDPGQLHRRHRSLEEVDYLRVPSQTKTVFVDTLVNKSMPAGGFPRSSPPPPYQPVLPSSPQLGLQEKPNRAQETAVARKKERSRRKMEKEMETLHTVSAERTHPPPPPPPPPQQSRSKSDRKRGGSVGSSSATKDFLNSLYHKKKKKQRQKSVDNLDFLLHQAEAPLSFQLPPSSPPSPPPPSVFQNLFSSKKHKRKRTITVTVKSPSPAPLPTPPEPPTPRNAEPEQNASSQKAPFAIRRPENFEKLAENSNGGGESPLNRVPPPPPLPPFLKKPAWRFVVQGDYVRLDSVNSSRSSDLDELDSDTASETGNATAPSHPEPLFCPSPDVNSKAESFITNFRAKLKLERHHSINKSRELGLSSLGPGPGPISAKWVIIVVAMARCLGFGTGSYQC